MKTKSKVKAKLKPSMKKTSKAKKTERQEQACAQGQERRGEVAAAAAVQEAVRPGRQGARRRAHPRFHACAIGPDLHAAARLVRRRRDQGRASGRGRHHARPAGRREGRGLALFHDAQSQQALDHDQLQEPGRQAGAQRADQGLRRAGGEFRARRARPHGPDLGAHPQAQSAHGRRFGEGLRPRTV